MVGRTRRSELGVQLCRFTNHCQCDRARVLQTGIEQFQPLITRYSCFQPMYYIMGHFSKFVLPDSTRIEVEVEANTPDYQLKTVGFETEGQDLVVIVLNTSPTISLNLTISAENRPDKHLDTRLDPKSIKTIIWKK